MEHKLARINNMSARETYDLVYRERRVLRKATRENNRKLRATMLKLLAAWVRDEPVIAINALTSYTNARG